ncbi:MAG TPA: DUF1796 family putative cysteine peptidase [Stenomitos sp.]
MYRFQVSAATQPGETIAIVGSIPELGEWDATPRLPLWTNSEQYPLWQIDLDLSGVSSTEMGDRRIEYKYVKILRDGTLEWEAWGWNRWIPLEPEPLPSPIVVNDGNFGEIRSNPYGYFANPVPQPAPPAQADGLKIVVIGSSVALGCSAWLLRGWAWHLGQALQPYGHQLVNVSEVGANVERTIARFSQIVVPEKPDIVIIALSLGNEGFASCLPHYRRTLQQRFENGLLRLIKLTQQAGALPVLGAVYPNDNYSLEHYRLLQDTHQRMLSWGVPVLDWLSNLDDGTGRWKPELACDPAHPNTWGQYRMYEAIPLSLFQMTQSEVAARQKLPLQLEHLIFQDRTGFSVFANNAETCLRIVNPSRYTYAIASDWEALQSAMQTVPLAAGLYMTTDTRTGTVASLVVQNDGTITSSFAIGPVTEYTFYPVLQFLNSHSSKVLFHDGQVSILQVSDTSQPQGFRLYIANESSHDYNLHPMWQEIRAALKVLPEGVYEDPIHPDAPFRTMMIDQEGLESRIKIPAHSVISLVYKCRLSEIRRVAILPLGDRCAARMLLYKLDYDGPAFPFDLTRTTSIADVADIIQNDFADMWNPDLLYYDGYAKRIYHTKWSGLSFAHEVEDTDDPLNDMSPVFERMRSRYSARAQRFGYTLNACDEALFVRTGFCDRASVADLVSKLQLKCQGKPFRVLLISPQPSEEFENLPHVLHYNLTFNPDRMYADLEHWLECTDQMRDILHELGISSKNLFWCPPTPLTATLIKR